MQAFLERVPRTRAGRRLFLRGVAPMAREKNQRHLGRCAQGPVSKILPHPKTPEGGRGENAQKYA